jgi:Skp family chaperone for outer membrane proteins
MSQESYSDYSIVKDYIEIKNKYNDDIKQYKDKIKSLEEKFKKHVSLLEDEIRKRNENLKVFEAKTGELTAQVAEKNEQLKTLGLQMHKLKMTRETTAPQPDPVENNKKKGFFSS